jgi:hypothetical protein
MNLVCVVSVFCVAFLFGCRQKERGKSGFSNDFFIDISPRYVLFAYFDPYCKKVNVFILLRVLALLFFCYVFNIEGLLVVPPASMAGRYDKNPLDEEEEVNPFAVSIFLSSQCSLCTVALILFVMEQNSSIDFSV